MNILIFTTMYPAPSEYGIPNDTKVVHYYAKQWLRAGHTVHVIYMHMIPVKKIYKLGNLRKCCGYESDYTIDGIPVHLLEYQVLKPRANYLSVVQTANANSRIKSFIDEMDAPDKVFVHFPCTFKGIKALSDFECPTMAVLHNIDNDLLKKFPEVQEELKNYSTLGGRNRNICASVSKICLRNCPVVLSGIDESLIPSSDFIEKKISKNSEILKIVYAGNLIKLKNVAVLIKALQQTEVDYQCEIIGDGVEMENLRKLAGENPKIVFRGRLSREETVNKMRDADVFVMVSSPETFGLVYLEAMAQGCIAIGSRGEGIDGVIVDGKNGFLISPGNIDELSDCIKRISKMHEDVKKSIVLSAYHNAASMTDFNMADRYLQLNVNN